MIAVRHVELYNPASGSTGPAESLTLGELSEEVTASYRLAVVELTGPAAGQNDQRFTLQRIQGQWVFWIDEQGGSQDIQWSFGTLTSAIHALVNHLNRSEKAWTSHFLGPSRGEPDGEARATDSSSEVGSGIDWGHRKN